MGGEDVVAALPTLSDSDVESARANADVVATVGRFAFDAADRTAAARIEPKPSMVPKHQWKQRAELL